MPINETRTRNQRVITLGLLSIQGINSTSTPFLHLIPILRTIPSHMPFLLAMKTFHPFKVTPSKVILTTATTHRRCTRPRTLHLLPFESLWPRSKLLAWPSSLMLILLLQIFLSLNFLQTGLSHITLSQQLRISSELPLGHTM